MEHKNDFLNIVKIEYLTPENAKFSETANGFPRLEAFIPKVKKDDLEENSGDDTPVWQDLGRVFFHRAFPYDSAENFISVTDKEGNEYGLIRSLSEFDGAGREIIERELKRKYYTPVITKIKSVKERFGYSYWEVETESGSASFAMHDTFRNTAKISEERVVLTDVDGNRYEIKDVFALDRKSYRRIELYL
ncbi:MAG: DUF1854 domain-containing protein [Clostridia bacterium]|nr:DUF1854 domain-containing protein [Clostridia bacterium]MBO7400482.1 DUF1854 domain-containing protein [Clostridia bacterium]MBP5237597.1 DUF1854 domain-containing protein [Clostridia bacterium]MBP5658074.1 DUF1854 domain-containing protein [Clostridia bacterium]MBP5755236.1 DUF1854 domain-containing protein [Clostridia bacterium]